MVGNDVAVIRELLLADAANSVLGNDFPVEQLTHLPVRSQFPVSARMMGIVDAPDTHLALPSFRGDCLPATAGEGAVDWTELVAVESHGILLAAQSADDGMSWKQCASECTVRRLSPLAWLCRPSYERALWDTESDYAMPEGPNA